MVKRSGEGRWHKILDGVRRTHAFKQCKHGKNHDFCAADSKKSGWHHRREKNDPTKDPTGSPTHES